jgi:hypothetical protein
MIFELIAVLVVKAALAPLKAGLSILADFRDRRVKRRWERLRRPCQAVRRSAGDWLSVPGAT